MKESRKPKFRRGGTTVVKGVSIPQELYDEVKEKIIDRDPEMDFSKYVRSLLRKQLNLVNEGAN